MVANEGDVLTNIPDDMPKQKIKIEWAQEINKNIDEIHMYIGALALHGNPPTSMFISYLELVRREHIREDIHKLENGISCLGMAQDEINKMIDMHPSVVANLGQIMIRISRIYRILCSYLILMYHEDEYQ